MGGDCLIRTWSPRHKGWGLCFFVSVCIPFHYLLSFWVVPSYMVMYRSWCWVHFSVGADNFMPQKNMSKGDIFVVLWGVALYCLRKWGNWVFQLNPSTVVARIYLFRVRTKRLVSPFASGPQRYNPSVPKTRLGGKVFEILPLKRRAIVDFDNGGISLPGEDYIEAREDNICWQWGECFKPQEIGCSHWWRLADTPHLGRDLQSPQRFQSMRQLGVVWCVWGHDVRALGCSCVLSLSTSLSILFSWLVYQAVSIQHVVQTPALNPGHCWFEILHNPKK